LHRPEARSLIRFPDRVQLLSTPRLWPAARFSLAAAAQPETTPKWSGPGGEGSEAVLSIQVCLGMVPVTRAALDFCEDF
jgi:hypothetical protein